MKIQKLKLSLTLSVIAFSAGLFCQANAYDIQLIQSSSNSRLLEVSGTGTVYAAPEEIVVELGVRTWNKDLRICYQENKRIVNQVLKVIEKHKIEASNIQTSEVIVRPTYPSNRSNDYDCNPDGYRVEKDITLVAKNAADVPALLTDAIENGANTIDRVDFRIENPRKYKDEARNLAINAAQEKAADMAKQVNARVGKVLRLREVGSNIVGMRERDRYTYFPNTNNNISTRSQYNGERGENVLPGEIATGQLRITSEIAATFEIID